MPKKPFEQLAARQKKRIHRVCLELLAANGYNRTSVKMITRRLKVADGYLHYYFEGKEDLAKWATEISLDLWMEHFKVHVQAKRPADIYELFKMTIRQMIRFTKDHRAPFLAYMRLVNEPNFPLADFLAEKISWIDEVYIEAIQREVANGSLRADVPPEMVAFVLDVLNTRIQEFYWNASLDPVGLSAMDEQEINAWIDQLVSILRHGIAKPQ